MRTIKYFLLSALCAALISCEEEEPIPTYSLSTIASPVEGGTITIAPSSASYPQGQTVTLTPQANTHWVFKQWEGDGSGATVPLTISMTSNKSVVGVFVKRDYPLNIQIEGEGTVNEVIVTNPSGRDYPHGTTVELTPVPNEGWEFENWGGDLSGSEIPKQIAVDKEKNVTVKFKLKEKFYLAENGITCKCEAVGVGEKGTLNGIEYEAVDNDLIRQRRGEGVDMTRLCTSLVTDMSQLFRATTFNQPIGNWDVGNVTDMSRMFDLSSFNQPIGDWDVSKVTNMIAMFSSSQFNQPIGEWDVSNVNNMGILFHNSPFNQPIGDWDVSKVTDMGLMFYKTPFNHPIGDWNVSNATVMLSMFRECPFNQPIGDWVVSNVTNMNRMFYESQFNQSIGDWDVSSVTNMGDMFRDSHFNQPIEKWDVGNVKNMSFMFYRSNFDQPIGPWNVGNVIDFSAMFTESLFSQNIENWNVSQASNMRFMFAGVRFNQPIGSWDVKNVVNMDGMFEANPLFNQDLSKWCVTKIKSKPLFFDNKANSWTLPKPVWGTCPD
ncbi:BspA family leucine-rich repeat surface protein [Aquiflexum sp.]|uniref:BspA family leucine-rich repeat surface protein n=1 Tax=Aquiflexum sp. TaxID=1872584 RepID=UPI0035940FF9